MISAKISIHVRSNGGADQVEGRGYSVGTGPVYRHTIILSMGFKLATFFRAFCGILIDCGGGSSIIISPPVYIISHQYIYNYIPHCKIKYPLVLRQTAVQCRIIVTQLLINYILGCVEYIGYTYIGSV